MNTLSNGGNLVIGGTMQGLGLNDNRKRTPEEQANSRLTENREITEDNTKKITRNDKV